jgi:hypothetical protein
VTGQATRPRLILAFVIATGLPAHAQIIRSTAPPLAPADAVAVLQSSHSPANVTGLHFYRDVDGPRVAISGLSSPTPGPWNWPAESPRLRLDGTPLSQPPDRYGPDFLFLPSFGSFGSSRGHSRSPAGSHTRHR